MLTLKLQTVNEKVGSWRIDSEYGFLRVTANVIKAGVFDYPIEHYKDTEEGKEFAKQFEGKDVIQELIPIEEFTNEAIASLEGKPVIIEAHEFKDVDNINDGLGVPAKKNETGIKVGCVAGKPVVKNGFIECDLLIENKEAIQDITNGKLIWDSAGYDGRAIKESGKFDGKDYDVKQTNLRFNHILLLPSDRPGRCGPDVRIINAEEPAKEKKMFDLKIKNAKGEEVKVGMASEADGQLINSLMAEIRTANEAVIVGKDKEIEAGKQEVKSQNDVIKGHQAELKKLQDALAAAQEALSKFAEQEYSEGETELVNATAKNEDEKKKAKTELDNCGASCKSANERIAARKKHLICKIMNALERDMKDAPAAEIDATFNVLLAQAKIKNKNSNGQSPSNTVPGFNAKNTNTADVFDDSKHVIWTAK